MLLIWMQLNGKYFSSLKGKFAYFQPAMISLHVPCLQFCALYVCKLLCSVCWCVCQGPLEEQNEHMSKKKKKELIRLAYTMWSW